MNKLKPDQREKVKNFLVFTQTHEKCAIEVLTKHNWDLEISVDSFFHNPPESAFDWPKETTTGNTSGGFDVTKLEDLYFYYKEKDEEVIGEEGMGRFAKDIGVDEDDIVMIIISWQLNAKTLGEFTKAEFVEGFTVLKIDSIDKLKDRLDGFRNEIVDPEAFKQFYTFVFDFAKDEKQTTVPISVAIELWKMFPKHHFSHFLDLWLEFLQIPEMEGKGVTRDVWNMLLEFCKKHKPNLSDYDTNACWPTYFDNFVEWFQETKLGLKKAKTVEEEEEEEDE